LLSAPRYIGWDIVFDFTTTLFQARPIWYFRGGKGSFLFMAVSGTTMIVGTDKLDQKQIPNFGTEKSRRIDSATHLP